MFEVQTALTQSMGWVQASPFAHKSGQAPPQSTPPSLPFFTPSVHEAGWHVPAHLPLLHSELPVQGDPTLQMQPPPQSTEVSAPFSMLSSQDAMAEPVLVDESLLVELVVVEPEPPVPAVVSPLEEVAPPEPSRLNASASNARNAHPVDMPSAEAAKTTKTTESPLLGITTRLQS